MSNIRTFFLFAFVFLLFVQITLAEQQTLELDTSASSLIWTGRKVVGSHSGTVKIKSGTIVIDQEQVLSGSFVIDLSTIENTDIKKPEVNQKLVEHLKSDDFFSVPKFPEASFSIKKITALPAGSGRGTHEVSGDLTIKGITKELSFPASISINGKEYSAKADLTFDRTLWDIRYNSSKFFSLAKLGDKLIYDNVEIKLKLLLKISA